MKSTFVRPAARLLSASIIVGGVLTIAAASAHAAANPRAVRPTVKAPVPASLKAVESSAEDIVDAALAHERGGVAAKAASLRAEAYGPAAAALARSGASSAQIARLKQRASRVAQIAQHGSFIGIALAANAVSELMPGLYGRFRDRVPSAILALDYLDREAQLRSIARQPARVALAVKQLDPTWTRVRPRVIAAGGARESAAFTSHVAAMKRLVRGEPQKLRAEAVRGLELVDELEMVFAR